MLGGDEKIEQRRGSWQTALAVWGVLTTYPLRMQRISISVSKRAGTAYGLALKTRSENTHKTVLLPGAGQRAPSPKRSNRILERFFGRAIPRSGHSQKSISNQNLPDPTVRDTCGIHSLPQFEG